MYINYTYKFLFKKPSMKIGLPTVLHFVNFKNIKFKFNGGYKGLKQGGKFLNILYDNI